jgi:hypothetical protein
MMRLMMSTGNLVSIVSPIHVDEPASLGKIENTLSGRLVASKRRYRIR